MEENIEHKLHNELQVNTVGLLKASKSDIANIVKDVMYNVNEGYVDKLDSYIFAKKLETLAKDLVKKLKPIAEETPINKGFVKHNVAITEGNQGVSWDYSETGDIVLPELLKKQEEIKKEIENRHKFLQTITKPTPLIDPDSGEVYTVNPPIKSGSLGFTLKIQ